MSAEYKDYIQWPYFSTGKKYVSDQFDVLRWRRFLGRGDVDFS